MVRVIHTAIVGVLLVLTGCADRASRGGNGGDPELPEPNSRWLDRNGGFTLLISNQSFAIDPVDVRVEIDGELVVSEYFPVGDQHYFVPFGLSLPQGKHQIRIWSTKGEAELSTEFELKDHDIGVVKYWYYPESHYDPTPPQFEFDTQKGPLDIY